ncbi:uncharacterized protein LOC121396321 isoform X2 [Xenopus laevis]|uniref:Uncharacterized protein LOC121396321 isoform X2 n=1 Tax=Xenopus laevis TaxID=8355 RepID=A0A8J1LDN2_XENLA|nr:uncharacterized protein LOC121396321 isoform X2 [Xenopus laevis]
MERGRFTAPRRRVLRPQRFRDEEEVGRVHASGAKRKVNFSPLAGRSNRRRRMMEVIAGEDAASSHGPEEEFGGSGSEEDVGGTELQASRDLDDVIAPEVGKGAGAVYTANGPITPSHISPQPVEQEATIPQAAPKGPQIRSPRLPTNDRGFFTPRGNATTRGPRPSKPRQTNPTPARTGNPPPSSQRGVPTSSTGRGPGKRGGKSQARTNNPSSPAPTAPPIHRNAHRGGGSWEQEQGSDEGEWGMEAESTPNQSRARHPGPFPRGGGNSRPRGTGGHLYFQTPRHRSQPQWSGEYDQWEDDDSCYFIEEYNYEDDCEFFPASSHGHRQRRPVRGMWQEDIGYVNNRVPSFYFRNREEEESWIQWRKEREQKGEEEAGPSRRQEGRERASSSTEGQSSQNGDRTKVTTRKTTRGKEQEDTKRRCSRVLATDRPYGVRKEFFTRLLIGQKST